MWLDIDVLQYQPLRFFLTSMGSSWLCGSRWEPWSRVVHPIINRLVPSPPRFKTRQWFGSQVVENKRYLGYHNYVIYPQSLVSQYITFYHDTIALPENSPRSMCWNSKMNPRLSGYFVYIWFAFLCVQVSSGNCEIMESCKICNFEPNALESC